MVFTPMIECELWHDAIESMKALWHCLHGEQDDRGFMAQSPEPFCPELSPQFGRNPNIPAGHLCALKLLCNTAIRFSEKCHVIHRVIKNGEIAQWEDFEPETGVDEFRKAYNALAEIAEWHAPGRSPFKFDYFIIKVWRLFVEYDTRMVAE